jgi:citrate synthase
MTEHVAPRGLEGLVVTDTTIGDVLGQEGTYHYRGYDAVELAREHTLEDVWHLMVTGELPDDAARTRFAERIHTARHRLPRRLLVELALRVGGGDQPQQKVTQDRSPLRGSLLVHPLGRLRHRAADAPRRLVAGHRERPVLAPLPRLAQRVRQQRQGAGVALHVAYQ